MTPYLAETQCIALLRLALAGACASLGMAPARAQQSPADASAVITVTSSADSGPGTLRDALERARVDGVPTVIQFAIGGDLRILTALPPIGDMSHPTTIDGTSAPSRVRIRSAAGGFGSAMVIFSPNNVLRSIDFYDVDFDMVTLLESADGNLFEDVSFSNCRRGIGLLLNGADANRFIDCRMENNTTTGIYCRDGCDFNQFGPGLRVSGNPRGGLLLRTCRGNTIAGTLTQPTELQSNSSYAIALVGGSIQNVIGPYVTITGGSGSGIRISDPVSAANVVQGTVVTGITGHAFSIARGTHHNLLSLCTADGATGSGILVDTLASQNDIFDCTVAGRAGASSSLVAFTDAPSNKLVRCTLFGRGVAGSTLNAYGTTLVRSRGCEISGGDFTNFESYAIGIAAGSDDCLVQDNRVTASGGRSPALGIVVQGAAGTEITGALLLENTLASCSQSAATVTYAVDCALVGNVVSAAANTGFRVNDGAQRIDLRDNEIEGSTSGPAAISLDRARDVRLFGNEIRGFTNGINAGLHLGELVCDANCFIACRQVGLSLISTPAIVTNNLFDSNDVGVGTRNEVLSSTRLVNNTYVHNRIGHFGGGEIWNCIFWSNGQDLSAASPSYMNLRNNDLQPGNPRIGTNGNVSAVPPFVSPTPITGDFHLQDVATPLIQGGSASAPGLPDRDRDGQPRILGSAPDMGFDEVR